MSEDLKTFSLLVNGQIEGCDFEGYDNLYCKYSFVYGNDWKILDGTESALSQTATIGNRSSTECIWNFPFELSFKSTNCAGWPRLVVSVYGSDFMGRDVIRGYGSCLVPTVPGLYTKHISMFTPVSSSSLQGFIGTLTGNKPEFYDSKFVAKSLGREVTRVSANGEVTISFNVVTHNMEDYGFSLGKVTKKGGEVSSSFPTKE
eukprot:TRINITY_DN4441_c0_g1_i1.p1 TRINITY_DN4441_c0_g1~~TRINITY_DN4441_c0_g1_i1.p1  ORF type:complete len:203 (+),score=38.63 TRINITY_DN4441_c0_g1_i1:108-716(+)